MIKIHFYNQAKKVYYRKNQKKKQTKNEQDGIYKFKSIPLQSRYRNNII